MCLILLFFALVLLVNGMAIGWRAKKLNLLLLSYVFYAAWNPPFVALLWISTLTDWVAARRIASSQGMARRGWLLVSLVVNLGLLGYFKYANFLAETSSSLLAWWGWSASMTTTFSVLRPMAPPALPRNVFFSERVLASKMGNSTQASRVSM